MLKVRVKCEAAKKTGAVGKKTGAVGIVKGRDGYAAAKKLLEMLDFRVEGKKVLVKPNLTVNAKPETGVTTDVQVVRAVMERLEGCEVVIGEGGSSGDMMQTFEDLGYAGLAREFGAKLVDLNNDEVVKVKVPRPVHAAEIPLARTAVEAEYVVNASKLKIHSLATVTLSLKNLFGCVPGRRNKLLFHPFINDAICDFAQVLRSDFNIIDGIVGNEIDEVASNPVHSGIVVGGFDALAVDFVGSTCMGVNPETVPHLKTASSLFGKPSFKIVGSRTEDAAKVYDKRRMLKTRVRYLGEKMLSIALRVLEKYR